MKRFVRITLGMLIVVSFNFCTQKQEEKAPDKPIAETVKPKMKVPKLAPEMMPLNVYGHLSKVIADTLDVQMYELVLKPGDSIALHGHLDHTVYVLEGGTLSISFNGGEPMEMVLNKGDGFFAGPANDTGKNSGDTTVRLLINEIYRPRVE